MTHTIKETKEALERGEHTGTAMISIQLRSVDESVFKALMQLAVAITGKEIQTRRVAGSDDTLYFCGTTLVGATHGPEDAPTDWGIPQGEPEVVPFDRTIN